MRTTYLKYSVPHLSSHILIHVDNLSTNTIQIENIKIMGNKTKKDMWMPALH